ncbi:MAG: phospholipid carrier-dependent glycosyltransferase [Schlesneria sp.]|nr:phospholipid carrier-dependent glycosyltransferase [Schlesneria sp.]
MIVAMPPSLPLSEQSRPARAELLCLAGAILFGAILRLGYPSRMAIEHFDEGVYASNFWFGAEEGYEYPARHLYAPPLLPAAIEWTMIIASLCGIRPTGFIPMIPSLIAGLAMIPSMWWVGRRWFGPSAGIVSAWFVAASDFHSSYSRAALTDVPVCLFILWGVYFTWQALQTGTRRSIILAALFTALAWWTKYNGWLPLAVGLSGGVAWQATLLRGERQLLQVAKRWLMVGGLSFLLWSPVLIGLQKHGGYGAVASNHKQYIEGFAKWSTNTARQLDHIAFYDGPFRPIVEGWTVATANQFTSYLSPSWMGWLPVIVLLLGTFATCLACYCLQLKLATSGVNWALLAWICGLTVATPCYHPYPRLVMPWMLAAWLGAGFIVQCAINSRLIFALKSVRNDQQWTPQWVEASIAIWLVVAIMTRCQLGTSCAWEDHTTVARQSTEFANEMRQITMSAGFPGDEAIAYVYAAPEIVFNLRANGIPLAVPTNDADAGRSPQPRPTFLVRSLPISGLFNSFSGPSTIKRVQIRTSSLVALDGTGDSRRILELTPFRN